MSESRSSGPSGSRRPPGLGPLERLGRLDPLERLGRLNWRRPRRFASTGSIVVVALAAVLVTLGITVALVAVVANGVVGVTKSSTAVPAVKVTGSVTESMKLLTGKIDGKPGWPKYTPSSWMVHKGQKVTVKITSYDDGTAPLTGSQMMFDKVLGSTNGAEYVNGRRATAVSDVNVAHTFTIVGLNFNMPIPAAPTGGTVTVVATFVASKTGVFRWQCYAPCGSGAHSMGGAMSTDGWMSGFVTVAA